MTTWVWCARETNESVFVFISSCYLYASGIFFVVVGYLALLFLKINMYFLDRCNFHCSFLFSLYFLQKQKHHFEYESSGKFKVYETCKIIWSQFNLVVIVFFTNQYFVKWNTESNLKAIWLILNFAAMHIRFSGQSVTCNN